MLSFESENGRTSHSEYYLPKVKIKNYNVKTDCKTFFDQPINNDIKTYKKIRIITTGQGDECTTGLLNYPYLKKEYKMIAIDLSKQKALDADLAAIQQINFPANLDRARNTTMLFVIQEAKQTVLDFSQGTVRVF